MNTVFDIKQDIEANGINVADWCRENGFKPALVYRILRGESPGKRGESYRIAVALGLKVPNNNSKLTKGKEM